MKPKGKRSQRAKARIDFCRHNSRQGNSVKRTFGRQRLNSASTVDSSASFRVSRAKDLWSSNSLLGDESEIISLMPPLEILDFVPGYEALSFDAVNVPPPVPYGEFHVMDISQMDMDTWTTDPKIYKNLRLSIPQTSEVAAKEALRSHVNGHCCWGIGPVKRMTVSSIRDIYAYHYILYTFTEKREARWTWMPHPGGDIDPTGHGPVPSPWDIAATPTKPFHGEVKAFEVPHTASIKPCHRCRGAGTLACPSCHGKGWTRCLACLGEGFGFGIGESRERCIVCASSSYGHGRQDCSRCGSKGRISCSSCDSYGQLKCFIQLTVSWKVIVGEYIAGGEELSPDLIRQVSGRIGLEETGVRLTGLPLDLLGPGDNLAAASTQLINDHLECSGDALLLAQRHQVRMVPVTTIDYQWKGRHGKYYVYGLEKQVYAPNYPQTCCCGCSII